MSNYILIHSGIKGQKWGQRRFQYEDGTLTPEGKKRYRIAKEGAYRYGTSMNLYQNKNKELHYPISGRYAKVVGENKDSYKMETGFSEKSKKLRKPLVGIFASSAVITTGVAATKKKQYKISSQISL